MAVEHLGLIVIGFVVLIFSAEEAIKKAVRIARHFRLPEFVISFVLVGAISVLPELSIGINAALGGISSFGYGILVGSNIADLTLVIGIVAVVANGIRLDGANLERTKWAIPVTLLPVLLIMDGEISQAEGAVLIGVFAAYVLLLLKQPHRENERKHAPNSIVLNIGILVACIGILFLSGNAITDSAQELGTVLGLPFVFLGSMLAIGTCLPEITFAIKATNNHHRALGFGDVIGNVFADATLSLGIVAIISPIKPAILPIALASGALMVIGALLVYLLVNKRGGITRTDGIALIILYPVFLAIQVFVEMLFV